MFPQFSLLIYPISYDILGIFPYSYMKLFLIYFNSCVIGICYALFNQSLLNVTWRF